MRVVEYVDKSNHSPFADWFGALDPAAAAKVTVALARMEQGNLSNAKGVRGGLIEFRIDFGPGYRLYFGRDGADVTVLLAGGTKRRRPHDIATALARWKDYKQRRKGER